MSDGSSVKQAVPFLWVSSMEDSVRFYVEGLGFKITQHWNHEGKLRWCLLERGGAALMLQEFWKEGDHANLPKDKVGVGFSICFFCEDALEIFRELTARNIHASTPFVGNRMWVTSVIDPDGYKLAFESPTDALEESVFDA